MSSVNGVGVEGVLAQMRQLQASGRVDLQAPAVGAAPGTGIERFAGFLQESLDAVNQAQRTSGALQDRYLAGDPGTNLAEVMVAGQKAEISFQSLLQVRNRVVEAYQEIMRMSV
ncbi:MAG: flagellar hook-basal body complex protein FliE [Pseudomonadota bacterium]|nr:flagellar hook-basal body complex protein FliE [Pseudomonadota bacterium]